MSSITIGGGARKNPTINGIDFNRYGTGVGLRHNLQQELPRLVLWAASPILVDLFANLVSVHGAHGKNNAQFFGLGENISSALIASSVVAASFIAGLAVPAVQRYAERRRLDSLCDSDHRAIAYHAQQRRSDLRHQDQAAAYKRHMNKLWRELGIYR